MENFLKKIYYNYKFVIHNFKNLKNHSINKVNKNILVEFNAFQVNHILLSYFILYFKRKFDPKFYAYPSHSLLSYEIEKKFFEKIKAKISKFLLWGNYGIYKSMGINNFIDYKINKAQKKKSIETTNIIFKNLKSKNDIMEIKYKNILLGDLIYDTYLKKNKSENPTINCKSKDFKNFLVQFFDLFFSIQDLFIKKKIDYVIVSHAEYSLGIPIRLGINNGAKVYLLQFDRLLRLDKQNFHYTSHTKTFKSIFNNLQNKEKKELIKLSTKSLLKRIRGNTNDIPYMTKTAYTNNKINFDNSFYKKIKNKKKILIAPHDFVDAPHVGGKFVFADMVEWLKFLVRFSKRKDYVFFLKHHPKMDKKWAPYQSYTRMVAKKIIKGSNIIELDSEISHNFLVNELKIDCVLTVWGRIAHEYAFRKVIVINASKTNIHSSFNFNLHAKNLEEYSKMLKNFKNYKLNFSEVKQFYSLNYNNSIRNWFFKDVNKFIYQLEGYHNLWSYKAYKIWMQKYDEDHSKIILKRIDYFIKSNLLVFNNFEKINN